MSTLYSPKTITSDLILLYDTGNKKSYVGEPTTNVKPTGVAVGHNTSNYGNDVEVTDAPEKGDGWKKVKIIDRGSNFRIIQWTYTSMAANTMYVHSAVFDWGNMRDKGYAIYFDGNGTGQSAFYLPNDYSTSQGGAINITSSTPDGKIAGTKTHTSSHTHAFFIKNSTAGVSGLNDYFYYKEFQVEVNTHPTQYTSGTRSTAQGLIDRTGNETITLSNMSYDSNAQMSFDGTDDQFHMSDPGVGTSFSIEVVIKVDNYSNGPIFVSPNSVGIDHFFRVNSNGTIRASFVEVPDTASDNYTSTTVLDTSKYYHVVISKSPTNGTIYVNGVAEDSHTPTLPAAAWSGAWRIGARWNNTYNFNGELPIFKIYNKALTSTEVLKNFNATKSRFGL